MEGSYSELADRLASSSTIVAKHQADLDKEFSSSKLGLTTFPTIIFIRAKTQGYIKYPSEKRDADTLAMWIKSIGGGP
jgi:adenylyl-sulfate reductase (glutathione)